MNDDEEEDHKRNQQELRAKRKAAKSRPKSESRQLKDKRQKEHVARVLAEQQAKRQRTSSDRRSKSPSDKGGDDGTGGSSPFAALFAKRSEGFLIDLKFRNAPPRPPVGPCFVGLGLEGELNDKWTKYQPRNAVERNYAWKLHAEPDLGVPLAPSAMDLAGCYVDPTRPTKDDSGQEIDPPGPPDVHPDDEALINWKGPVGDTAAEELQRRRDRRRAEALGVANVGGLSSSSAAASIKLANRNTPGKKFMSRVLNEKTQSWMKKTTYLANDQTRSVHQFKSLAETKQEAAAEIDAKLKTTTEETSATQTIEAGFQLAAKQSAANTTRRHPTKRGVTAVYDFPLLPDASTWGHKYTHVVLDKPPGPVPGRERPPPDVEQLERAFVADVAEREVDEREMAAGGPDKKSSREFDCNLLVPTDLSAALSSEPTGYDVAQRYDMTVLTLKDAGSPHNNFILMIDEENGTVTYHTLWTRLNLSSGRPGREDEPESIIAKRAMQEEDVTAMERIVAEVDDDLARKHAVGEYEDDYGGTDDSFGGAGKSTAAGPGGGEEEKKEQAVGDDVMEE